MKEARLICALCLAVTVTCLSSSMSVSVMSKLADANNCRCEFVSELCWMLVLVTISGPCGFQALLL